MAKILVVDDEPSILKLVTAYLKPEGYEVFTASDGPSGLKAARAYKPDILVLDIMLPGMDGIELLSKLRRESDVYVIMLTAKTEEIDKIVGLSVGADDYVTKPFSVRELMARIKAVLRRAQNDNTEPSTIISGAGNLRMDVERRAVTVAEIAIELTRLEFDLLHRLLINPGRVLTRERLLEQAWGYDYVGDTRAVDSAVKRLRAKLRAASPEADCIESVCGLGYRIN